MGKQKYSLVEIIAIIILIAVIGIMLFPVGKSSKSSDVAKATAQINQLFMAINQYKSDYGAYPLVIENLEGKNLLEKAYYLEGLSTKKGSKIFFEVDDDDDGYVLVEGDKIAQKVAIWTDVDGQIIKSWK